MANVIGPDVSFYQDDPQTPEGIDFVRMRQSAGYVIIRSGQNAWVDRDFKVNWREAKRVGLPRGSYWFYDSRADPKQQAELWASVFSGDFGELPLFADFEDNYGGAFKGWRHWYTFLERIKQLAPGREIGIYTAYYYWVENTVSAGIPAASLEYFKQYPLWIANYGVSKPLIPKPWSDWTFWQFTDKGDGSLYGVESLNIDLNYFNGDLAAFRARFKLSDSPVPVPEPTSKYFRVTVPSLKVREGPGLDQKQIGSILLNEVVYELGANADRTWLNIRKLDNSLSGWSFSAYLQRTTPPTTEPAPEPEPPPEPAVKWHRVTTASLRVREGPSLDFKQIGSIVLDEVVREIGANADRSWLQIRKADGSLTGWCSSQYLQETSAPAPEPEPIPEPEPPPAPKWYRVTTASLRVREGAGTNFNQIGSVTLNEIVQEIGANADRSWLQIRKSDGSLTGWVSAQYLQETQAPAPPPDEEDRNWYRVITASLKVREGPGLDFNAVGLVHFGELVEKIGSTTDGVWLKIRNKDQSLEGWCLGEYLQSVHSPTPEPPPSAPPIPDHKDKNWYRANAAALQVRDGPNTSSRVVGTVSKNDTLPALDDASNPAWVQIERLDGLKGWCPKASLVLLGKGRPASITQNLFPGVTYLRKDLTAPRPNVVHVLAIDLQTAKLEFLVTPAPGSANLICTRVTSKFLEEFKLHAAINGGYYRYLDASYDPAKHCPKGGDPVTVSDYAASRGRIYSPKKTAQPIIYIGPRNLVTINKEQGAIFNAISGDRIVVDRGEVVKNLAANAPNPRTAVGLNKNGRWLTLMVVDGRQPGYSEGVTFPELAELLISYGVYSGVNMDGGGSSTMVIRGMDGKARVLNSPIDKGKPGKERPVANHLGLYIKP